MNHLVRVPLLLACTVAAVIVPAGVSEACWCSRVFTRSYCDPCVSCPTATRSYGPVSSCPTACPTACPTTSCSTTNVERCYYEAQTTYETRTLLQPQTSYIRRSYYDPMTCCNRSYLEPTTQYVERSYQVPVTGWVKKCSTEPVTSCTTSYGPATGASYYVPERRVSSYYSSDGYYYYPVYTTVAPSCPVPGANGGAQRESSYGPADSKKNGDTGKEPGKAPDPVPMPEKKEGASVPGAIRTGSLSARPVSHAKLPTGFSPSFAPPIAVRPVRAAR